MAANTGASPCTSPPPRPLFDWQSLEDRPSLVSLRELLRSVPDARLLKSLRQHRSRERNDCTIPAVREPWAKCDCPRLPRGFERSCVNECGRP